MYILYIEYPLLEDYIGLDCNVAELLSVESLASNNPEWKFLHLMSQLITQKTSGHSYSYYTIGALNVIPAKQYKLRGERLRPSIINLFHVFYCYVKNS